MAELFDGGGRMTQTPTPPAPFDEPWHGQVFALAVALNEAGHFGWPEWTDLFGATLADMRKGGALDGSTDYYVAWVTALEAMMIRKDILGADLLSQMKSNWTEAFLRTPHGSPVKPDLPAGL
ncbi:MAG: nitrile hydratase accessory protein [Alphaproteobacteria bacterium]|nr:nitrile hydratase accessory protein [Alphaproteobacteria bacterium]